MGEQEFKKPACGMIRGRLVRCYIRAAVAAGARLRTF
jgi:hypothetical protein